jgi:hypothetical protein
MATLQLELPRARALRNLAVVFVVLGLFTGSLFWADDAWPFAPFRMFARGTTTDVHVLALEADYANGRTRRLGFEHFNLRRAEIEGQIGRFTRHPEMLGDLIAAYNRQAFSDRRITALRVLSRRAPIENGRLVAGDSKRRNGAGPPPGIHWDVEVIAEWPPQ